MLEYLVLPVLGFAILYVLVLRSVYRAVVRPPRVREGWALGRGLPLDPDHLGVPWHEAEGLDAAWILKGSGTTNWLLLHGHGRSRRVWMHVLEDLLPHAGSVVVVDFPGHGDATGEVQLGRCEHEALTRWLESSGSRWHVAGMSMGAGVALRLAAQAKCVDGVMGLGAGDLAEALAGKLRQKGLPPSIFVKPVCWWLERQRLPGPCTRSPPLALLGWCTGCGTRLPQSRVFSSWRPRKIGPLCPCLTLDMICSAPSMRVLWFASCRTSPTGTILLMTTRTERDSMGEMEVPSDILHGASTQRAVLNFPISGRPVPAAVIKHLRISKKLAQQ